MSLRPAFRSRAHATAYAAFSAFSLALPLLLASVGRPTRSDVYRSLRQTSGPYAYIEREALEERSDIDMAFVGPSHIVTGIDTLLVQRELSAALGRPAVARTLGFGFAGMDETYALLQDVLDHRRLKTVVLMMPRADDDRDEPHPMAYRVLDLLHHGDLLRDLSWRHRAQLYGDFVLGGPRHLLSLLRPNPRDAVAPDADTLGATRELKNLDGSEFLALDLPPVPLSPAEMIYSPETATRFEFTNKPLTQYQAFFVRRITLLLASHDVKGIAIHLPTWTERRSPRVTERLSWPDAVGLPLVGVAGASLFAQVAEEQMPKVYGDTGHLNRNGSLLFTGTILPALIALHVAS